MLTYKIEKYDETYKDQQQEALNDLTSKYEIKLNQKNHTISDLKQQLAVLEDKIDDQT